MDGLDFSKKATILVVDDAPENLALMNGLLKEQYRVRIATNGRNALKIAVSQEPPDLILLDIMMPEMDGYEVCRQLKRDPGTTNIPVIFLTALAEMEDEKKGLEMGAVDYIVRPISAPIFLARVRNHLALKAMSDFLQEKNVELDAARLVAEKANHAKSEFLSSMSHELRSPLNAILGFAQLMESESPLPSASQQESITQILQAGWHLLTLINEILDLAKIESGQMPMLQEPVSLAEVLEECEGMTEPQAQQRGIRMQFPGAGGNFFVLGDRMRVKQVVINLLSNAIKYNSTNGSVKVSCTESSPGRIRVSVRDTGPGLAPGELAQLYQPFNRIGREAGTEEGTGIGLVVVKRLVGLMGGEVGVESNVDVGSVFWFELVAAAIPISEDIKGSLAAILPPVPGAAAQYTLLYVEDNPANMQLVASIIARHPELHLLTAVTGELGLTIARESRPDAILMDINLPGISGIEAMRMLRQDPATAHIPVIALSSNATPADIAEGLRAGFRHYVTKPIKVDAFMAALTATLGASDGAPAPSP